MKFVLVFTRDRDEIEETLTGAAFGVHVRLMERLRAWSGPGDVPLRRKERPSGRLREECRALLLNDVVLRRILTDPESDVSEVTGSIGDLLDAGILTVASRTFAPLRRPAIEARQFGELLRRAAWPIVTEKILAEKIFVEMNVMDGGEQ